MTQKILAKKRNYPPDRDGFISQKCGLIGTGHGQEAHTNISVSAAALLLLVSAKQ